MADPTRFRSRIATKDDVPAIIDLMRASIAVNMRAFLTEAEIKAGIPNLCRCGVYPRLVRAIQRAGRVARRSETISAAPAPGINAGDAAREVPAISAPAEQSD